MDAATTSYNPPADTVDTRQAPSNLPQLPDRPPVSVVAQRRTMQSGAICSPVRRSPRLSCLPQLQPQLPVECQHTNSEDESESVNEVVLHLSREETPENDVLPLDEPSTVLANKILRAHDNPSPPPQGLEHPVIHHVLGRDRQLPSHAIFVPPSPFRSINLMERLNQLSDPPIHPPRSSPPPASGDRQDASQPSNLPPGSIASEPCSPFAIPVFIQGATHENTPSGASYTQITADHLSPYSSRHVCELTHIADNNTGINSSSQPTTTGSHGLFTSSPDSEAPGSCPTDVPEPSPSISDVHAGEPPSKFGQQSSRRSSPLTSNTTTLPLISPTENGKASTVAKLIITGKEDNDEGKFLSKDNDNLAILEGTQEGKCANASLCQSLPSHSTNVLLEPIEQMILPAEFTRIRHSPVTLPQTPRSPAMHPDFSQSTVRRPLVTPTPIRRNIGVQQMFSPAKFSFERDDICRTPAQRVPIEAAFARGTTSYQKALQLSTRSDYSQQGCPLAIRAPVFARPALDDPSRSPAKRVPVTEPVPPSTRGDQSQSTLTDQRSLESTLTRSQSVEHSSVVSKPDRQEKAIFPSVPFLPKSRNKLPFPLIPDQKSVNDLPPPVPEGNETAETTRESDATLGVTKQGKISQLRQPSANSRIPRIGNKPYARRVPSNGKATIGRTNICTTCVTKASVTHNGNLEASFAPSSNDLVSIGSLKRKRGTEAVAPSTSHPVIIRQVLPGMLSGKYAQKPAKVTLQPQEPFESTPSKVTQPLKFRKVVDGMLSARYAPAKTNLVQTRLSDSTLPPPSPLSELSSSSNEEHCKEGIPPAAQSPLRLQGEMADPSRADGGAPMAEPATCDRPSLHQDTIGESSVCSRRTSRTRKPVQQQNVLDIFNSNTTTRPLPARRKPQSRTEGDGFMGMSATALKALTTSNTTKNQQTVAVLATEVIRKEGLRPESPTVKARTILQKQRDERDMRRRERAQRKAQMNESLGTSDTDVLGNRGSPGGRADCDENDCTVPQKHCRGPGDEEDYETPERPERIIESLRLEEEDRKVKQVKWHRGLSTMVYLDEVDPRPKPPTKNSVMRGCLASTSKNLSLDPLGNLVDIDNRPPELVTEQIIVKRYLYDNDIELAPIPAKMTRSKSKKK